MDEKKFRAVEARYKILSGQHKQGEIDSDTLKKELKKIMIQDEEGKYWMIGGKTGKWYVYDGKAWNEKNPFQEPPAAPSPPPAAEAGPFTQERQVSSIEVESAARENGGAADYSTAAADQFPIDQDTSAKQEGRIERDFSSIQADAGVGIGDSGAAPAKGGAIVGDAYDSGQGAAADDVFGTGAGEGSGAVIIDAMDALKQEESSAAGDFEVVQDSDSFEIESPGGAIETGRVEGTTIDLDGGEAAAEAGDLGGFEVVSTREDELAAEAGEPGGPGAFADGAAAAPAAFGAAMEDSSTVHLDAAPGAGAPAPAVEAAPVPTRSRAAQPQTAPITRKFDRGDQMVINSVDLVSMMFFLGGVGLIVGVLLGATSGIFTGLFGGLIDQFPEWLKSAQGGLAGGLIFAAMGGIAGFIFFAIMGAVISSVYNIIASIFGGVRLKIK